MSNSLVRMMVGDFPEGSSTGNSIEFIILVCESGFRLWMEWLKQVSLGPEDDRDLYVNKEVTIICRNNTKAKYCSLRERDISKSIFIWHEHLKQRNVDVCSLVDGLVAANCRHVRMYPNHGQEQSQAP